MSGISHPQAIQWIHRRLDGLLNESQLLSLEEHLRSCDKCSTYAAEMELLPLHLRHEFHTRWDKKPGPSQQVVEQVMTKTRNIPMTNRISSGVKLLAGAMALILLGVAINFVVSRLQSTSLVANATQPVGNAPRPEERLLAFASDQNGNLDIYTMGDDGSGLTNLTNNPAWDSNPTWSPDGKRIAFESDRDGFTQIYWMNADGSDVVQLTHSQASHFLPMNIHGESHPWSPDGSKLLFLQQESGAKASTLYSLDMNSGDTTQLATGEVQFNDISWSPDGKHIGYVLNDSPTPESTFVIGIYVVDPAGDNPIAIKDLLLQTDKLDSPAYYWSKDGSSIIFTAYRHLDEGSDQWIAYEYTLDSQQPIERATSSQRMEDWWEGTSFIGGNMSTLTWLRSDGTFDTFKPLEACQVTGDNSYGFMMRRSPNGSQVINIYCPNSEMWFYYANSDGTIIKPLMNSPIPSFTVDNSVTNMTWSSDDHFIAVTLVSPKKSSLYILNVKEPAAQPKEIVISSAELYEAPSWRPASNENIVEEKPTPQPTQISSFNGLFAFTSEQSGNFDIYTMHADGSGLINLTNDPASDSNPIWSPDGTKIAFTSDRTGNTDIFLMNADGSELSQLTDRLGYDGYFSWSPDGTKIAYSSSSGNDSNISQLVVMNADGSNKTTLTEPGSYIFLGWSPNGQKIVYQKQFLETGGPQANEVHVVNVDGTSHYQWPAIVEAIQWTDEAHFLGYGWSGQSEPPSWILNRFSTNGDPTLQVASHSSPVVMLFENTYVIESGTTLTWYSMDGNPTPLGSFRFDTQCDRSSDPFMQETNHLISPDGTHAFVTVHCPDGLIWFYYENADGSAFQQLTDFTGELAYISDQIWSPDGNYVIVSISKQDPNKADFYLFDIQKMLKDPSTQPIQLTTDEAMKYEAAWQPAL
jgi:Tol biopolymer transport system component